jgi:hypothetical protein
MVDIWKSFESQALCVRRGTYESDPSNLQLSEGYVGKMRGGIIAPIFVAMRGWREKVFAFQVMFKRKR